jgi:multidrug efflux pump subunit AcrA (membrane-fusion protein)
VERKDFTQSLRLNGTTQASRSFVVLAPKLEGAQVGSMVITKLAPAGTHVQKGDILVEFDPQARCASGRSRFGRYVERLNGGMLSINR